MFNRKKVKELQALLRARTVALKRAEAKLEDQNAKIRHYENKIRDLEANVDFLTNNLSPQKKKLIRPENQN